MKFIALAGFLCLGGAAWAQDIHFDYDRSANFAAYRTYQWIDLKDGRASNQLIEQNIKSIVDGQLVMKGLQRVESGADVHVAYQVALDHEKQLNGFSMGPRWNGFGQVNTSTVDIGKLVVSLVDPVRNQLVWRGDAAKTLDIGKDPDKNYKNLEKAITKLFKNFPPESGKK